MSSMWMDSREYVYTFFGVCFTPGLINHMCCLYKVLEDLECGISKKRHQAAQDKKLQTLLDMYCSQEKCIVLSCNVGYRTS